MTLFVELNNVKLQRPEDISTLREALSFAEGLMKEKPASAVRLYRHYRAFWVTCGGGLESTGKAFPMSSTTKDSPSSE